MTTIADVIAEVRHAFPTDRIPDETIVVYVKHLADLDPDQLAAAAAAYCREAKRFPTIADLRRLVAERNLQLPDEAEALRQANRRADWYATRDGAPPEMHPLVRDALRSVGGPGALRESDQPSVVRGQFLRVYRDLRDRQVRDETVGKPALPASVRPGLLA